MLPGRRWSQILLCTLCCTLSICRVAKVVAPKKEKLAAAESEYSELMAGLNHKKAELAGVEANLAALNAKLKEMQVCTPGLCCGPVVPSLCLLRDPCSTRSAQHASLQQWQTTKLCLASFPHATAGTLPLAAQQVPLCRRLCLAP